SPSELRAEKPDDVLFAGSPGHPAADFCEVELLFDNEDGALEGLDFSDVSIARRLHRGGEGQYLVNRASVRRTDLVELLADVGRGARLAQLDLVEVEERLAEVHERRTAASLERKRVDERLEALLAERNRVEEELASAAGRGEGATSALYRLKSVAERIELRQEAASDLAARLRAEPLFPRLARNPEREALRERARLARERLGALEHSLAELEGLPPAARALAEDGERLALSLLEVEAGYERAVAAALFGRAAAVIAADASAALGLVERARKGGLGGLAVLVPPRGATRRGGRPPLVGAQPLSSRVRARPGGERVAELLADVWLAEPSDLARAESGILVTREGHCFDADRGELVFAGETAEAVLLQLDARRRALAREVEELEQRAEGLPAEVESVAAEPLAQLADRLSAALEGAAEATRRFEAPLQARVDAGAT